jgi:hypothetical protein
MQQAPSKGNIYIIYICHSPVLTRYHMQFSCKIVGQSVWGFISVVPVMRGYQGLLAAQASTFLGLHQKPNNQLSVLF